MSGTPFIAKCTLLIYTVANDAGAGACACASVVIIIVVIITITTIIAFRVVVDLFGLL